MSTLLSIEEISKVLELACLIGKKSIESGEAPSYSDSTVSEDFLVVLIKKAMIEQGHDENRVIHHKGHAFPDVSITGTSVGIELKGASSSRKFNGNSVVASTMLPNLKKIYLMYWIGTSGDIGFRDYFDCVATPVVTHSPRFQLDIDLNKNSSMFGSQPGKVGTIEDVIFTEGGIDSEKIIKWMSDKARAKKETPWWISTDESLPVGSTGLIKFSHLSSAERQKFQKSAFLAFPKILGKSSPSKYKGCFEWAISTKSVLTTRDNYSAKGQVSILIPKFSNKSLKVPRVIQVALDALGSKDLIYLKELEDPHGKKFASADDFITHYQKLLEHQLTYVYENTKDQDLNNIGKNGFSKLLSDLIISNIDKSTLLLD